MRFKKAVLAPAVLLGAAVAIPVAISGPAHAQENARICGTVWQRWQDNGTSVQLEEVWKIYEVTKGFLGRSVCDLAEEGGGSRFGSPGEDAPKALKDKMLPGRSEKWVEARSIDDLRCEDAGNVASWKFLPDRAAYPAGRDDDICTFMERSDGVGDMEAYWMLQTRSDPTKAFTTYLAR